MDWIRRNWPDLLIGFALLAVISGIVATLMTGGSFFPLGQGSQTASQSASAPQQPVAPPSQGPTGPAEQPGGDVAELPLLGPTEDPVEPADQDSLSDDGPVDPFADLPAEPQDLPAVVPLRPGEEAPAASPVQQPAQEAAPAAGEPADTAPAEAVAPPAATPQLPVASGEAPSAEVPYTVGVGAFRSADNANRQADVFRQAGYPVVVAQQDELTVILLGPYATQTEAERVRTSVASGGFDVAPIVYTYQGEDAPDQAPAAQPAAPAAPQQPAAEPPAAAATATEASRYLQVGAYSSTENASAQRSVLEGLGYDVLQQQDGQLIRVLVGPYPEQELAAAQNRLAAQGIDSVPR